MHSWVASAANIGLVSYVCVQLYEQFINGQFRGILHTMAAHQTFSFAHLSSDCVLTLLPGSQTLSDDKKMLIIDRVALDTYMDFRSPQMLPRILDAVKTLIKARRKRRTPEDESDEE